MTLTQPTALADWAPHISVSLLTRLLSYLRSAWVSLVHDNPIAWRLGLRGRANEFEDMEGVQTRVSAIRRATRDVSQNAQVRSSLSAHPRAKSPTGKPCSPPPRSLIMSPKPPLPTTRPDVLTPFPHPTPSRARALPARPHDQRHPGRPRAARQNRRVASQLPRVLRPTTSPPGRSAGRRPRTRRGTTPAARRTSTCGSRAPRRGRHAAALPVTTQAYVLRGNDPSHLGRDVLGRFFRSRQDGPIVTCYAASEGRGEAEAGEEGEDGKPYRDLQKLPAEGSDLHDAVGRWNARLTERGVSKPILSVGRHEIKLTAL